MNSKSVYYYISHAINYVISLIYPPQCIFCGAVLPLKFGAGNMMCGKCAGAMEMTVEDSPPGAAFEKNVSIMKYGGARGAIFKFKYGGRPGIAKALAELTYKNADYPEISLCDCAAPVPLHDKRRNVRGYNQAELYAKELAALYKIPFAADALMRVRDTAPQSGLNADERRKNVEGAFRVNEARADFINGKTVLLADDIRTTGSTLNECSIALKNAGARAVYCVTFAAAEFKEHDI